MKRKDEPIEVRLQDGRPAQLVRTAAAGRSRGQSKGQGHAPSRLARNVAPKRTICTILDVLEEWDVTGRWWARETTRHYMLVRTDHGTFELCRQQIAGSGHSWMLTGIAD